MTEQLVSEITNNILEFIKITEYEMCIINKIKYGYKLSKKENEQICIIAMKIKAMKMMRRIIDE